MVEKEAAVWRAARCLQQDNRSVVLALAKGSRFATSPDCLKTARDLICLILQVESVTDLHAVDKVLAGQNGDGLLIVPSDLTAATGHFGNPGHPVVLDAVSPLWASDKVVGMQTTDTDFITEWKTAGATFAGIDVIILTNGLPDLPRCPAPDRQPVDFSFQTSTEHRVIRQASGGAGGQ